MEEALISKKELLELTGISYGALYRWKRKRLIPDEWFIHRATFTGQETFFPREKILERIEKIKLMKDTMSLDDIAETFDPMPREVSLTLEETVLFDIASRGTLETYIGATSDRGPYSFDRLAEIYLLERLLKSGDFGRNDALSLVRMAGEAFRTGKGESRQAVSFRKMGVTFSIIVDESAAIIADDEAKTLIKLPLSKIISGLKQILDKVTRNT